MTIAADLTIGVTIIEITTGHLGVMSGTVITVIIGATTPGDIAIITGSIIND